MVDRIILFPYSIVLGIRDFLYRKGWKKSQKSPVPSICVGNVTVGGTGKTPHTEMILKTLLESKEWEGKNLAMLSRGYKRRLRGFQKVSVNGSAASYGDEPLQIASKFPEVTVAVDKNRIEGCEFLCDNEAFKQSPKAKKCKDKDFPSSDLIVLDDAFQYRKLSADVNILLVDYNRPIFKDMLIPFGGLRDFPSRIADADVVIVTKCPPYLDEWERGKWAESLGFSSYNQTSCKGTGFKGKSQTLLFTKISYGSLQAVFPEDGDRHFVYSQRLILFSGIARDTQLRGFLSSTYKIVRRFVFGDHHKFTKGDIRSLCAAVKAFPTAVVVTTEKDAQRVRDVKNIPEELRKRLFHIPIEVNFLSDNQKNIFEQTLLSSIVR